MFKKCFISEIAKDTYAINEYGMSAMFLLVGSQRALLIDAGSGTVDLKQIVEGLTDKPIDVVLTHNHGDHIGAIPQFEKVYIHPLDEQGLLPIDWKMLTGYVEMMGNMGTYEVYDVKPEDVRISDVEPKVAHLEDGQLFDLGGGRKVKVLFTPGHTAGHCSFLDVQTRILFSGDSCNINLGLSACPVSTALQGLLHIKEHEQDFDQNWNGHIGYAGQANAFSMPPSVLDDCIYLCEHILAGTASYTERKNPFAPGNVRMVEHGKVLISYDPEKL